MDWQSIASLFAWPNIIVFFTALITYVPLAIAFLLLMTLNIFWHELVGHWHRARWYGMQTPVFCIGVGWSWMTKKLFHRWGTDWCVAALPLGGYVMLPDIDMNSKPSWRKADVIAAGPLSNLVLAVIASFLLIVFGGLPIQTKRDPYLSDFDSQVTIARDAGFQKGDRFKSIAGEPVIDADLASYFKPHAGQAISVVVERRGCTGTLADVAIQVTPNASGAIGVRIDGQSALSYRAVSLAAAPVESVKYVVYAVALEAKGISWMLHLSTPPAGLTSDQLRVHSIFGLGQFSVQTIAHEGWRPFLWISLVWLNINLFLVNMLPVPVLDGGHLFAMLYRSTLGRVVNPKLKRLQKWLRVGMRKRGPAVRDWFRLARQQYRGWPDSEHLLVVLSALFVILVYWTGLNDDWMPEVLVLLILQSAGLFKWLSPRVNKILINCSNPKLLRQEGFWQITWLRVGMLVILGLMVVGLKNDIFHPMQASPPTQSQPLNSSCPARQPAG